MPKAARFKKIKKYCLNCNKLLVLNNNRDIERKNFCCRSCKIKYQMKVGVVSNPWDNPQVAKKMKKNMKKPHIITEKLLKAQRARGLKRRKPWRWYVENGSSTKFHQSQDWKDKAKEIYKRDNYICQECGMTANELRKIGLKLNCHHIIPIDKKGDLFDNNNLITLCEKCHQKKHPDINFFKRS